MADLWKSFLFILLTFGLFQCQFEQLHQNVFVEQIQVPVAAFGVTPTTCIAPCEVTITNTTIGVVDNYLWDFGDGDTETLSDKTFKHVYDKEGNYTINLTASNAAGSNKATPKTIIVSKKVDAPIAGFEVTPTSCFAPCEVTITNTSVGVIDVYQWNFGDGKTGSQSVNSFTHTYDEAGEYTITFNASNEAGSDQADPRTVIVKSKTYTLTDIDWIQGFELEKDQRSINVQVRLTDQDNNFISGILIDFDVVMGGGSIENAITDANGIAGTVWHLEGEGGKEEIKVSIDETEEITANDLKLNLIKKFGEVTESREDKTYNTVFLNNLVWMAENLDMNVFGSSCYERNQTNCEEYGRLYTWYAATTVCSNIGEGWRLPLDSEWNEMAKQYGLTEGDTTFDGQLAYNALIKGGMSGFDALLGGGRFVPYSGLNNSGYFWTNTEANKNDAWSYRFWLNFNFGLLIRENWEKGNEFSVRCVKDDV